jgi:putative ABC transport system permease protein
MLRLQDAVAAATHLVTQDVRMRRGQVESRETIYWADPDVFRVLPLPVFAGVLDAALQRPDGLVLTRSAAVKYFGRSDPIGQFLQLDGHPTVVTAVLQDLPANGTQLDSGLFASGSALFSGLKRCEAEAVEDRQRSGISLCGQTYLQLRPGASVERLQMAMSAVAKAIYPNLPELQANLQLIRLDRVHLFEATNPGITGRVVIVGTLGFLILCIAGLVFVNLSSARSAHRVVEVGIRKASGAGRGTLIVQFLGESLLYTAVAMLVALSLVEWLLPHVNAFLNSSAALDYAHDPELIAGLVLCVAMVTLLAGGYPAFALSAIRPAGVLRQAVVPVVGAASRQALVTVQFAILIGMLVATTVIFRQQRYAIHDAVHLDTRQMLILPAGCTSVFKTQLRNVPGVRDAFCSDDAWLDNRAFCNCKLAGGSPLAIDIVAIEPGIFRLYGVAPLAGQFPLGSEGDAMPGESRDVIINAQAARQFGFASPAHAVGQLLPLAQASLAQLAALQSANPGVSAKPPTTGYRIVAVMPDFSMNAAGQRIRATLYEIAPPRYKLLNVRLKEQGTERTLRAIDRLWAAMHTDRPIDRFFVDEYLKARYLPVLREAQALGILSLVAVLLACLGLVGLAAATLQRRIREIGIRKALGADTAQIITLLLWQLSRPVLWASLLAWPVSAYLMNRWLQGFASHVTLAPWLFPAATAVALVLALSTIGTQCYLAARARPTATLRYE